MFRIFDRCRAVHNVVRILQTGVGQIWSSNNDSASVNINGNTPVPLLTNDGCRLIATTYAAGIEPPFMAFLKSKNME
jgi:hypothetical protein